MSNSICPHFGKCGGCAFLNVPYSEQLAGKQKSIEELLRRVEPSILFEAPVSGPELGYRSRARFRYTKEGLSFYESRSNTPVFLKACPVLDSRLNEFISNPPKLNLWELEDGQLSCFSCDKKVLYGSAMGWVTISTESGLSRSLAVSSDVFFQSNLLLLPSLIDYVVSLTGEVTADGAPVMDLYAGVGTFSAFLEDRFRVTAVEINKKCISLARQHLKKTEFFTSPVEKWNSGGRHVDTVIVDPPRVGLDKKVPSMISSWKPKSIIYVSCYAQTLARDLERFKDCGYRAVKARMFDFYPQTPHTETCVLLVREQSQSDETMSITVDLEGINIKQEKKIEPEKITYDSIKDYVIKKYGFKIPSIYIAQVKSKLGIKERENYNIGEGKAKIPNCPPEKEEAIKDALRHFGLI